MNLSPGTMLASKPREPSSPVTSLRACVFHLLQPFVWTAACLLPLKREPRLSCSQPRGSTEHAGLKDTKTLDEQTPVS